MGMRKQRCRSASRRRRRNKILRESNFPEKSKFSSSNSFCADCTRVTGPRTREPARKLRGWLLPRRDSTRTRSWGQGVIVVTSTLDPSSLFFFEVPLVQILCFLLKLEVACSCFPIFTELLFRVIQMRYFIWRFCRWRASYYILLARENVRLVDLW